MSAAVRRHRASTPSASVAFSAGTTADTKSGGGAKISLPWSASPSSTSAGFAASSGRRGRSAATASQMACGEATSQPAPPGRTAMTWSKRAKSSAAGWCTTTTTAKPRRANCPAPIVSASAVPASWPVVSSSRQRIDGKTSNRIATSNRRYKPSDKRSTRVPSWARKPVSSATAAARWRRAAVDAFSAGMVRA